MTDSTTQRPDSLSRLFLPAGDLELTALRGYCAAHSRALGLNADPLYVYSRTTDPARKVGLVSGGGSGHEPMHAGLVGAGGLDAAVPGRVFASPHNRQVYEASRRVAGGDGVLHIVKNYTGDRIHFGIAAERLVDDGILVARVLVDDDIATDSLDTGTGRRGTGATVIVEKLLGALADTGAGLAELKEFGDSVVAESRSLAVASAPLTSFATRRPAFEIAPGTIEYGIGIHGEPAPETIASQPVEDLVEQMVGRLLDALPMGTDRVIVLVNGLGGTTALELGALMHTVELELARRGVTVDAALVGTIVSALDMRGFLLTLTRSDDERVALWLRDAALPGLPTTSPYGLHGYQDDVTARQRDENRPDALLDAAHDLVIAAHARLTQLDQLAGDGDFGDNLVTGIVHARRLGDRNAGVSRLAHSFLDHVGGSSGPLIGLLLSAVEEELASASGTDDPAGMARRLQAGVVNGMAAIQRAGGAEPGDRTMVDALHGASTAQPVDVVAVLRGAAEGAEATASMRARQGRASYVGNRALGAPDAGAVGVVLLLAVIAASLDEVRSAECYEIARELIGSVAESDQ